MDDLSGAVVQMAVSDSPDYVRDIGGFAHSALGKEAGGDSFVIDLLDFGDHVGADNAGLDLEHLDAFGREPLGVNQPRHTDTRFRDAIFGAIDRGGKRGDGGDEDDAAPPLLGTILFQHPVGGKLGEEMRALQVGVDQFVKALFGRLEHVTTLTGCNAGVVDEKIETFGKCGAGEGDESGAIGGSAYIATEDLASRFGPKALGLLAASEVGGDDFVIAGELTRDPTPDAAAGSRYKCVHLR